MKIYLVNPPAPKGVKMVREGRCMQRKGAWGAVWPPITLALIGALLKKEQHDVKLIDCITEEINANQLYNLFYEWKPDLVIINTATPSIESDLQTAQIAKQTSPSVKTAALGIHVTALPEESFLMQPALDIIVRGEPEITILEIVRALYRWGQPLILWKDCPPSFFGSIDTIDGISYQINNTIKHNADRKPIDNLDTLPFPDWSLIKREHHIMPFTNRQFLLLATSRGCPYPCTFCADATFYGKKLRLMSPKRIVDEMVWNHQHYGINDFLFWAEGFTLNKSASYAVADEIITRGIKSHWVCNSRVDTVDFDMLKKFKEAGCWMIGYGIESGNEDILRNLKKNVSLEQIYNAVRWSQKAGLMVTGHFVIGNPKETKKHIKETVVLAQKLKLDFAQFYCAVPFPGSALYKQAQEEGWICTDDWTFFEQNYSVLDMPDLKAEETMKLRRYAYRKFYFNPHQIIKTIRRIRSFEEVKLFFIMLKEFFTWI